ncbi:gp53-like domain-containing protein [Citrobacter freundii]|uniref:gp53-like domain-containing protein n=1 Tax=Citrobacter freundii TaxID=546 RepID=UPI001FFE1D47|nr:hypothetical protein [Citrobacter freundii]
MSKIARYQGNVRAFASDAQGMERTVFGGTNQADDLTSQITASFLRGWGIVGASEHPSLEDFNAAMYAMSQFIAYQHQMGVPEWHAQQEYHIGSICTHNGESYQSLQNANIGSQPPSAKWTPVLTSKNGLANLGLQDVLHKGNGRLLTGTYVSDTEDAKSIGARAATGCQFMRAYKAPDAPDQVNYWQIITMTDVVSPTSQVVVLAITTTTNAFAVGYGTGQGITMWRSIPALEGASFTGNINAPSIAAEFQLKAGQAIFRSDGDIYGNTWGAYGRLSGYLTATFPKKTEVDEWLSTKPNRQFITQVGLYQGDKTKPFMLHDDGTGVFLATKDMLSIASLGMTGWHKDNSTGLITQWGEVTTSQAAFRVNFPLAFPNACFGVTVSDRSAFSSVGTSNRTTTGFDLNSSFNGTTNSFYIAKGI